MDWSRWPQGVLEVMLEQIDQPDRSRCALVCSNWAVAAAAATRSIQVSFSDPLQKLQGVIQWLGKHGECVTHLDLASCLASGHGSVMKVLPCPKLQQLCLQGMKVQLEPWGRDPGILKATTGLTQLVLQHVTLLQAGGLVSPPQLAAAACKQQLGVLSALQSLQHLELCQVEGQLFIQYASLPSSVLQTLVQLTHLHIEGGLSDAALQHLSCLTGLQQLRLQRLGADTTPAALEALGALQQLKALLVEGAHFTLGDVSTPSLASLTGLHSIRLHSCNALEPAVLSRLTALQELQLKLTPLEGGGQGTATLLSALPKLRQLTALQLTAAMTHVAPNAAAYSALRVTSQLHDLWLSQADLGASSAWWWLFHLQQFGQQLTQLPALHLSHCTPDIVPCGLQTIVNMCPCLHKLSLYDILPPMVPGHAIVLQLPQLTELRLNHVSDTNVLLSQLTHLSSLFIEQPSRISDDGLVRLTGLQQLTFLLVASEGISRHLAGNTQHTLHLVQRQADDQEISVHQQLLDRYLARPLQLLSIHNQAA